MAAGRPITRRGNVRVLPPSGLVQGVAGTVSGTIVPNGARVDVVAIAGTDTLTPPAPENSGWVAATVDTTGGWTALVTVPSAGSYVLWARRSTHPRVIGLCPFTAA